MIENNKKNILTSWDSSETAEGGREEDISTEGEEGVREEEEEEEEENRVGEEGGVE